MVIAIVLRLLGLVQPFAFQTIIDRVLPFQRGSTLSLIVVVLMVATLFSACLDALSTFLGNNVGNRLTAELGRRIYHHVLNLPLGYLQRWQVGETLTRIGEIDTVRAFLTSTVSGVILDVLFALVYVFALLSISPFLTIIVLIMLPLQIIAFALTGPFLRNRMQESFLASSRHQSRLVEAFGNAVTVKALACEDVHVARFQQTLNASLLSGFLVVKLDILNRFIGELLGNGSVILIILFGSQLVFQSQITLGELIAFHLLAEKVSGPILSLSTVWERWQGLRIARLRLGDFLNIPAELDTARPRLRIRGPLHLRVTALSFGYVPDQLIINDMTLDFGPDTPTIIVGDSGCGKSTLAKLMSGLYAPDAGRIEANGQDLAVYDPQSVRQTIAYLPQEPVLFSGSILDNLLMAKPNATEDEIRKSLADSASELFIEQLADGIHTDVGERGGYLSGGQRQRIALARLLLCDPKVLILDEPTSALDAQSAAIVIESLKRLATEKTLIVVTHDPVLLGKDVRIVDLSEPAQYRQRAAE
ncbi:peptidase domain-containing ABC transporter [Mesorhizobium sp. M1C.F.Ca.ET.193.01.1.1]|uniref:peptidase domain-containing ABC transporter n=1 Tax=unclassified Mesorhizobium TaxID=325217 RepID=UPI000FD3FBAE|nr:MULTISPECIES: peptidase domain-containing ABC transporter [unclassified Mesorhizobium]TGS97148.1 peptidase domain-containing ABC transporter [bacterium M00.F.Ca.ET.177.01.1.1]TGQ52309.1 peptidase domain-containing ABC transporter [Mesorhizobium sp. M1C.F.Ca.ET.210.01.1.1]TGQ68939.1 peptidase domain-containing ABC transporter [Mesorhizobium sp. M1C.F.Ca.ET.212.01.1.1]TGR04492.1 peptidase domain-containing ABC transporter [Mesorhizobium sp. M1C.F.Ca.ET.204.01.1.1]TGR25259.1 peptidase domain-c